MDLPNAHTGWDLDKDLAVGLAHSHAHGTDLFAKAPHDMGLPHTRSVLENSFASVAGDAHCGKGLCAVLERREQSKNEGDL